jgi:predicted  nucleic acid-binding Zn-ribbon protein
MDRQDYVNKIKEQLDNWNTQIDRMQEEARKAGDDAQRHYQEQLKEMRQRRDEAEEKMREARGASEKAWDDLSKSYVQAWHNIAEGFKNASRHFK